MNTTTRIKTLQTALVLLLGFALSLRAASVIQFSALTYNATEGVNAQVEVTVLRANDLDTVVSVDFATTNLSATAGLDYTDVTMKLSFAAGSTNQTVAVPILNDGLPEGIETFQVLLSNPTGGAELGPRATASVRVTDNDRGLQLTAATFSVSEEVGAVAIEVLRGDDGDFPVTVDLATSDGTAIAGADYVGVTNAVQFAAGEILKSVPVAILNDAVWEPSKNFRVTLSNPTGGGQLGSPAVATVTITDQDETVRLEFANYYAGEETAFVRVGIVRGESATNSTVGFQTTDGSARAGLDYEGMTNTLAFSAGEQLKLIDIPVMNDGLREANESFRVTLSNPTGGARLSSPNSATITITDNDPGVQFEYSKHWVLENEEAVAVKVQRGNDVDLPPFTVDYATANSTAIAGVDYLATAGTLAFAEGELFQLVSVPILSNQASQADRQFTLTLSNPSSGAGLGPNLTATIVALDTTGMEYHRFEGIAVLPDGSVQLTLRGRAPSRFASYFDLYPVEVSFNLVDWLPLVTLERTNALPDPLTLLNPDAAQFRQRFYRTPPKFLVTPLPPLTGPHPVGTFSRLVTDPARRNPRSANHQFMVTVWYPATPEAGIRSGSYLEWQMIEQYATFLGYPAFTTLARAFVAHSLPDALLAKDPVTFPVVLYSPSANSHRRENVYKVEELASHGYIVVGMDHRETFASVFPDGKIVSGQSFDLNTMTGILASLADRAADARFLIDELSRWNASDPVFEGRLDLQRIGAFGFSIGGATAAELCRREVRCKAGVGMDGWFVITDPITTPFLMFHADEGDVAKPDGSPDDRRWVIQQMTRDGYLVTTSGTVHWSHTDMPLIPSKGTFQSLFGSARHPLIDGVRINQITSACIVSFFNKYLKGQDDRLLDNPTTQFPEIIEFIKR